MTAKVKNERVKCRKCGLNLFVHEMFHNGMYVELLRCMSNHDKARAIRGKERKRAFGKEKIFRVLFTGLLPKGMPVLGC